MAFWIQFSIHRLCCQLPAGKDTFSEACTREPSQVDSAILAVAQPLMIGMEIEGMWKMYKHWRLEDMECSRFRRYVEKCL